MKDHALSTAIERAGGPNAMAKALGISHQAVVQWRRCPPTRAVAIEEATGISRHILRPDVFGPAPAGEAAA